MKQQVKEILNWTEEKFKEIDENPFLTKKQVKYINKRVEIQAKMLLLDTFYRA